MARILAMGNHPLMGEVEAALERCGKSGRGVRQVPGVVSQMHPLLDQIEARVNKNLA